MNLTAAHLSRTARRIAAAVAGALLGAPVVLGVTASPAAAATPDRVIEINTTADAPDADPRDGRCDADPAAAGEQCTLRAAIMEANRTWELDEIRLPAGTYELTETGRGDDDGVEGDLDVHSRLVVRGAGQDETVIDGRGADRIFDAVDGPIWSADNLELSDLTLRNGIAANPVSHLTQPAGVYQRIALANQAPREDGGAVRVTSERATLRLERVRAVGNVADGRGGAVYASGRVAFVDSTFEGNESFRGGGAAFLARAISIDDSFIAGSTFANNTGKTGGAIYTRDTIQIETSAFTANEGGSFGGAIAAERGVAASKTIFRQNEASFGGAFYSLEHGVLLFVDETVFEGNDTPGCDGTGHVVRGTSTSDDPTCVGR